MKLEIKLCINTNFKSNVIHKIFFIQPNLYQNKTYFHKHNDTYLISLFKNHILVSVNNRKNIVCKSFLEHVFHLDLVCLFIR